MNKSTDRTRRTALPERAPQPFAATARWIADLHCLWRYCDAQACRHAMACRRDVRRCIVALALVPAEARAFVEGLSEAQAEGLPFDEAFADLAQEWEMLQRWQALVAATRPDAAGRAPDVAAIAFSSEVGTGSRDENASKQKAKRPDRAPGARDKPAATSHS